jgi:hypothetical protein
MAKHGCVIEDNDTGKPSLFYYCLLFWDKNNWNSIWPEAKIRTKNKPVLILNSLYLYQEKAASFTQCCNIFSNGKTW